MNYDVPTSSKYGKYICVSLDFTFSTFSLFGTAAPRCRRPCTDFWDAAYPPPASPCHVIVDACFAVGRREAPDGRPGGGQRFALPSEGALAAPLKGSYSDGHGFWCRIERVTFISLKGSCF